MNIITAAILQILNKGILAASDIEILSIATSAQTVMMNPISALITTKDTGLAIDIGRSDVNSSVVLPMISPINELTNSIIKTSLRELF